MTWGRNNETAASIITVCFVFAVICIFAMAFRSCHERERERCERAGGTLISVYKGTICVRPGTVIEAY